MKFYRICVHTTAFSRYLSLVIGLLLVMAVQASPGAELTTDVGSTTGIPTNDLGTNDLSITGTVETVPPVAIFAKEPNIIKISDITNTGTTPLTDIGVAIYASDVSETVPVNTTTIATLPASGITTLSIIDPTKRSLEGGTLIYRAIVDPDNLVAETNETNNVRNSSVKSVRYNGYKGKLYWEGGSNLTTRTTYDINGNMIYSTQPSTAYKAVGWSTRTETWSTSDLPLPSGATIENVFLYISYNWDQTSGGVPDWTAKFNANTLSGGTLYTDKSNFGTYANYMYGLYRYDVTSKFSSGGNSLVMTKGAGTNALYPSTLVVIYSDPSATRKQIFINEECDELLYSEISYGTTLEEATAYAPFTGMIVDTSEVWNATLYSFAGSAGPDEGNLFFNGNTIGTNAWQGDSNSAGAQVFDVKSVITASGNVAAIQGTSSGGMDALQQILVVEYAPSVSAPVAAFITNITTGTVPLTVSFMDRTRGTPTSWMWDFGDGSTSTNKSPVHTYTLPGTYTINLTATNALGTNSTIKTNFINATLGAPIAAFTANKTVGDTPLAIQFTDLSTRWPVSWAWDFGDSTTSTNQNPVHTYTSAGTYTVNLVAKNTAGSSTKTRTRYITVNAKVITENGFNLTGVKTVDTLNGQNVSIDSGEVPVNTTGSVVTLTGIGNGWTSMDLFMNNIPEIGASTVNGTIAGVRAVGENITVPIPAINSPAVHIELALEQLPHSTAYITETITKTPDVETYNSFARTVSLFSKQIDEIAYIANFTKSGIANKGNGGIICNATVYFAISPTWVSAHGGTAKIVILHKPDTGPSTILTTKYLNRDADNNDLFSAVSTNGLSKFALAAVSPTTSGSSMTTTDDDDSSTTPVTSDSTNTNAKSTSEKKKGGVYDYALTDMSYGTASYQVTTVSQKGRMAITPLKAKIESMPDAKASWSVEIVNDPDGGGKISSGIISSIPENVLNSYHRILDEQSLDISSVAYSMSVIKDDRIGATREGIVWMTAPQQWVSDNGGETRIKILRISDEGKGEILKTSFSNYDMESGYLTFKGDSPDGLCSFTLIAVKPLTGRVATSMESDTGQINSSSTKWRDEDRFLFPNGNGILSNALLGGILIVIGCSGLGMIYWIWKREGE